MFCYFIMIVLLSVSTFSKSSELHLADSHGPISVMGDHMHKKGEIMLSYRFVKMKMDNVMLSPHNSNASPMIFDQVDKLSIKNLIYGFYK